MKDVYNLTTPQKSILLTEQFYGKTNVNNVCGILSIEEKVDFERLKIAINLFVKNNDSFQIRLIHEENEIKQYFVDYTFFNINKIFVQSEKELKELEKQVALKPFELIDSPLFSFTMFEYPTGLGGFIINCHHIIADSWTNGIVANEVTKIYSELSNNKNYIEEKNLSYIDYISSEQNYIKSEKFQKDRQYWNDLLKCVPEPGIIPSVKDNLSASKEISLDADRLLLSIDDTLLSSINQFCKENRVSSYNFFMAVFAIYIGRVSNLDNFMIGTPILNRTNFNEKHTTGMFINTIPFKFSITENTSFSKFISSVARDSLNMLKHQKYSYQYIIEDIRKKSPGIPGLYNIVLSYQTTKMNENTNIVPHKTAWTFNGTITDDLDIHLYEWNEDNSLHIAYDYKTSKYTESDLSSLHSSIIHIINQVLNNNEIDITKIEIVTPEEKHKLLYEFNSTKVDYPRNKTIVELFEEQVEKTPNKIALVLENKKMTYKELNEKSNSLANYLRQNGITHNCVVALRLDKSFEMIISILGIIKAGACYLPINLSYPEQRVDFMIKDSNAKLVLTSSFLNNDFEFNIPSLFVDLNNTELYSLSNTNLPKLNSPEDLIYIIYTSGSTGTPKGVMLTHKNVVRLLKNDNFLFDFSSDDVWTMFHSVAFDFSVWEMYGALLFGGKLILVPDNIAKNPDLFLDLLRKEKVTVLNQTPTYFYNLLDCELNRKDNSLCIKYIIFGGEALNPTIIKPWKEKYPTVNLINMYGITETTVHVTYKNLSDSDFEISLPNIGKPIPTLKMYVLDKYKNLLPFGAEGEICVSGDGVCKGYLNRDDLNKIKFIKNPYESEELLYTSGDTAFLSENGDFYYKGRIDNQVKVRGFRIELGEIESKILKYPEIEKCVVLPSKVDNKDAHLIAFLVSNTKIDITDLKNYMYHVVPTYMVPNYFIQIDTIPLNINGKVDRKKLLSIDYTLDNKNNYVAPRNTFEEVFINILEKALHINHIGIDDNILDIGSDSLTLMKISIELLKESYTVNIQDIYQYKTVRNISDNLASATYNENLTQEPLYFNFDNSFSDTLTNTHNNILLTGSTGFLGIHILYDLLKNTDSIIYCLVRDKKKVKAKDRLIAKLRYYFDDELLGFIDNRIQVVTGDIVDYHLSLDEQSYNELGDIIDTVIHSAALVAHYGDENIFQKVNVEGTNHVIDFCEEYNIKLNHISTISVAGDSISNSELPVEFNERTLYVGQNCNDNIYTKTKFNIECNIIKKIKEKKLIASIYRLGNITARFNDQKFQENDTENAFLNRLICLLDLGMFPKSYLEKEIDFSPVDYCSKIITTLLQYQDSDNKIFHISNPNTTKISDLIDLFQKNGFDIDTLSDYEFKEFLKKNATTKNELGIINDITSNRLESKNNIEINSDYTINILSQLNLKWPIIKEQYILSFFNKYIKKGDNNV